MGKDRFSATRNEPRKGFARLLGWFVRAILIAVLLVFTVLLVWAFESRKMPALGIWHTTSLTGEFTARDATPGTTLKDYLEQEERQHDQQPQRHNPEAHEHGDDRPAFHSRPP